MAVRVRAADEDSVFLHKTEPGRCFASSGQGAVPGVRTEGGEEGGSSVGVSLGDTILTG